MDNDMNSKMNAISLSGTLGDDDDCEFSLGLYRYLVFVAKNCGTVGIRTKADDILKAWIRNQDKLRRSQMSTPVNSNLTSDRIMVLNNVQFPWQMDNTERWEQNYSKLVEFYRAHGHCNVPRSGNTSPLGEWVSNQRRLKKQHANGVHNSLTSERVALLDAIGFWF